MVSLIPTASIGGISLAIVASLASPAEAQSKDEFAIWNAVLATARLSPKPRQLSIWFDLHSRRGSSTTTGIARPGMGVQLTSWLSLWGGYAWIPTFNDNSGDRRDENRLWQQAIFTHRVSSRIFLQARTRVEQRFGSGDIVAHRIRQFVRADWVPDAFPIRFVAWDEFFVGLRGADWGPQSGYDQNRAFLGIGLPIDSFARVEIGYLNTNLNRTPDNTVHALALNLFIAIDRPSKE